jgi:hypothetical protein
MSEETEVVANPLEDLVQAAMDKNFTTANELFTDLMQSKVTDALDQEKIAVANQIYNGIEPEEDDIELSDEELEDALEDDEEEVEEWPDNPLEGSDDLDVEN